MSRDNAWHPESEFKSIEEAATKWERSMAPRGPWGEDETTSILVQHCDIRLLIADWRKRGEALKPFARQADNYDGSHVSDMSRGAEFYVGDLRAARAALTKP